MPKIDSPIKSLPGHIVVPETLGASQVNTWLKRMRNLPEQLNDADGTFSAFYGRSTLVEFHLKITTPKGETPFKLTDKQLTNLTYPAQLAFWVNELLAPLIKEATNTKN